MKYNLIIKLKSDLCSSSGTGLGSLIDNDIVYDDYGFPFIPAKRIKGLLREAALEYTDWMEEDRKYLDSIFGVEGSNNSGNIKIDNAYVENYEKLLENIKALPEKYKRYLGK